MATQNILPTLQADEKSAQLRLHPVPIQNGLIDAGRMLTDAGQGLQKASFGLMLGLRRRQEELQAKEDNLLLAEAKNRYLSAMTTKETELDKRTGKEAAGSTKEIQDTSITARDKAGQIIQNSDQLRAFNIWADQQSLSYSTRQQKREYANVNGAEIEKRNQVISNDQKNYVLSGDAHDLDMLILDAQDQYVATFGGNQDVGAMNQYVQNVIDETIGKRLDNLFKEGKLEEGIAYFDSLGKNGVPDLSEQEKKAAEFVVNRQREILDVKNQVQLFGALDVASGGEKSFGGKYRTAEQDLAMANRREEIQKSDLPEWKKKMLLDGYDAYMKATIARQEAALGADVAVNTNDLGLYQDFDSLMKDYDTLNQRIDLMPDSIARDTLISMSKKLWNSLTPEINARKAEEQKAYSLAKQYRTDMEKAYKDWSNDKTRQSNVALLKNYACMRNPVAKYNGRSYDLTKPEEREAFLFNEAWYNYGPLVQEDIAFFRKLWNNEIAPTYLINAEEQIKSYLNDNTKDKNWKQGLVAVMMPSLVDEVMLYTMKLDEEGNIPKGSTKEKALREFIQAKLSERRYTEGLISNSYFTGNEFVGKGLDEKGNVDLYGYDLINFSKQKQTLEDRIKHDLDMAIVAAGVTPGIDIRKLLEETKMRSTAEWNEEQRVSRNRRVNEANEEELAGEIEVQNQEESAADKRMRRWAEDAAESGLSEDKWIERIRFNRESQNHLYPTPDSRALEKDEETRYRRFYAQALAKKEERRRAEEKTKRVENIALAVDAIDQGIEEEQELRTVLTFQFGRGAATKQDEKRVNDVIEIYRKLKREGRAEQIRNNAIDMRGVR